jgi:hypothetical protein
MVRRIVFGLAMLAAAAAHAQTAGVITFRASQTSGTGSVTPVLTWSTNPAAVSCTAGGGWTGTKAASGTQTLPAISATTNYTLTCSWGGDSARLSWNAPATNTDGSVLNDLSGFRVLYGTSSSTLDRSLSVNDVTARTATVTPLTPGTWYFAVRAVNSRQAESDNSNVAQLSVAPATAAANVTINVTSTTPPPTTTLVTDSRHVYDVTTRADGTYRRVRRVGTIALGKPCSASFATYDGWNAVSRSDVRLFRQPSSQTLVGHCRRL